MSKFKVTVEIDGITNRQMQSVMAGIHDIIDAEGIDLSQVTDSGFEEIDPELADHRGAWGIISEGLDAEAFQEVDLDEIDGARYMQSPETPLDLIMKAENEGLDTEMEFSAYIWTLVTTGLINSTGSNQRIVADYSNARGEDWQEQARTAYETLFDGGPR